MYITLAPISIVVDIINPTLRRTFTTPPFLLSLSLVAKESEKPQSQPDKKASTNGNHTSSRVRSPDTSTAATFTPPASTPPSVEEPITIASNHAPSPSGDNGG